MKSTFLQSRKPRVVSSLFAALVVVALLPHSAARAQSPAIPPVFQDLYTTLNTDLNSFNTTLNGMPGSQTPTLFTGNLKDADSNAGPQLASGSMVSIQLQLQELKSMGVQAIMVEVGFPVLYEPFLTSQGQSYAQWVTFYQQLAALVRAAGLKLIIENDTLLTNDVQAGWNAAPFYATLNWTEYQQARAQTALTIAQTMQPDYIVVLEEPKTEADNSGQTEANTVSGSVSLLSQILASVQQSGVPGMQVGAGTGTAQVNPDALSFIQQYVTLPLNFIDFHVYPINGNYLAISLQIASTAAAAGMPVAMTEYWLWKVRNNELGVLTDDEIRARDPFSFWAPLDAYFLQTMQSLARHTQMLFMDPFGSTYFAAYLPYDSSTDNLTPTEILNEEGSQAAQNLQGAIYTSTAMSYYASLVSPPDTIPPTVPTGVAGSSNNPDTAALSWNASTDNVGTAGYYVLRGGAIVGTTANLFYQDSGLTQYTTYTYSIEAFDLAGNVSVASRSIDVTTKDTTPPTTPGNVAASAASCQKVTVTWSASTDNAGIGSYLVFSGLSPAALTQAGRTLGTTTAYSSSSFGAGTTYYFGVEAVDTSGNVSAMSGIASVTTPMPPAAPGGLTATPASAAKIGLTWFAAASGGLPVQYYHVFRGTTASNLSQVAIVAQTSFTDNSLNPSTTYYYGVEAADTGNDVSAMSVVVFATTPTLPAAPTNLVATPISTSKIGLTWLPPASGGLPIQNYHVYRGTTTSNLSQVAIVLQASYTDSTVSAGATYYYAVAASDTGGDLSPMSAIVRATAGGGPSAPTNLVAAAVSTTKVGVSWSAPASGGLPIRDYAVFRGSNPSNLSQVATVAQTSYNDASGSPATTYYYAVQATDTGGDVSPMSATVSATTLALPSAPTNLVATAPGKTEVSLTWTTAQSGMPLASYTILRGNSRSSLTWLKVVPATQTSTTDYTVAAGATYYYGIEASDTGGNVSPLSAVVSVTTP
jgi:fibronectin type 3 domain-containing protein